MVSRRRFLLLFPAYTASAQTFFRKKSPPLPPTIHVFIGTDTTKGVSKGIYHCTFNTINGRLSVPILAAETARPSYLALTPPRGGAHRFLYAVNAIPEPSATVTTFDLDPRSGLLTEKGKVTSGGAGPAYVSVDSTGHAAFVADYYGGAIASYRIEPDGTLSHPVDVFDYKDPKFGHHGPVPGRQDGPHPHSVFISPDDRFLIVNDLGNDALSVFHIDLANAKLTPASPLLTSMRPGSGPRHIAFHPNGRWVYVINELDSTIDHLLWTTTHSMSQPQGLLIHTNTTVKTTAPGFPADKNTAAEVMISSDGNFLYASNRGEDTLVVFAIGNNGSLKEIQRVPCGGKTPRHFTFDPTYRWILCGNQDSASITVFRRDEGTGKLAGPTQTVPVDSPLYTLLV
ncbi:MAG TPA: lactonase family protein [Edaphobacter sp.]|jgi:6-phosphogluconolactonase|nr:lactonase family protein [Edaphobacter sp.]